MKSLRSLSMLLALGVMAPVISGCPKTPDVEVLPDDQITDPAVFYKRGLTKLQAASPDYAGAYADFKSALGLKDELPKVHFNAGWTAERLGKVEDAERHYRRALELDAGYTNALLNLANLLIGAQRYDEAVSIYEGYVSAKPTDLEARNSLVGALTAAGRYEEAIKAAQDLLLVDPENVAAYRNLSRTYFAMGDYGMSLLCADKAKTLNEGDPGIYNNMGVTYLTQGDQPSAIDAFKTAIKLDADNVEANLNLGYVALNSGDYALAKDCFLAVTAAYPENVPAQLGLAVAYRGVKEYSEAEKVYDLILKLDPSNEVAYFNAATLHEKYTKDFKKALKILEQFKESRSGTLSPDHEVFARIERVKQSQAEEDRRIEEEKQRAKEREERKKMQMEQLTNLKSRLAAYNKKLASANCPAVAEMGMLEEFQMIGEQAQQVIDAEDFGMAGDMITFLDSMEPTLDELAPMCGGASEPAPSPEQAPAPEQAPTPEQTPAPEGGG